MFAKIFDTEEHGQILVKKDSDTAGDPEIRTFFIPEELGVCSVALGFPDTEAGWSSLDKAFESVDEKWAAKHVAGVKKELDL